MKQVVVHPERCVGCMQCMPACATAHSRTGQLYTAIMETPLPKSRVHVGAGLIGEGFPNRCRHCNPAPCMMACLPGAIFRDGKFDTVLIDPDKCINCASCAMVCPFGAPRFSPVEKMQKCNFCIDRITHGLDPACVHTCTTRALGFGSLEELAKKNAKKASVKIMKGLFATGV